MAIMRWVNLALRAFMEVGIILALGYWGFQLGNRSEMKIILGIGAPLVVFGFWGLVDFRKAGSFAEILRLIQELVISGFAAYALYVVGTKGFALMLAFASLLHHILVYISGETLLKKSVNTKGV
jgi:thiol:disulfide interchange protein